MASKLCRVKFRPSSLGENIVYLFLVFFWLAIGILFQVFWPDLELLLDRAGFRVDRMLIGFLCFVLVSYNLVRWRMARLLHRARTDDSTPGRRRRLVERAIDPTFDFSDHRPTDGETRPPTT